jgi:hypothetical protein
VAGSGSAVGTGESTGDEEAATEDTSIVLRILIIMALRNYGRYGEMIG